MNQGVKKFLALISIAAMASVFAAGCGNKSETSVQSTAQSSQGTTQGTTAKEEPFKITMLNQTYGDAPVEDNRLLKNIEEFTNTKLDITWVPAASYQDRFLTTLASGELPMTLLITDDKNSAYLSAVKQGAFWEAGAYLMDCPNLSAINQGMWENAKYEGKNYMVPRWRAIARNGILYRKDWADSAGIKEPKDMDELYTMIKTFGTGDFDKNGKVDSTGFVLDTNFGKYDNDTISYIASVFGASSIWGVDANGKVVPNYAEKEFIDALKWLRQLYSEKLINQDFAMLQNAKQVFAKGNTGVFGNTSDDIRSAEVSGDLPKNASGAQVAVMYNLTGPKGIRSAAAGSGYFGGFVIPKSSAKSEDDVRKVMAFLDKMADEKMVNLLNYGQEGVDYKLNNGVAEQTADQKTTFVKELASLGQINCGDVSKLYKPQSALDVEVYKMWAATEKTVVLNPVASIVSPTWTEKGADLLKIKQDAVVKFVMGVIDENGYNDAMKKWYSTGGDKVCEEFTAALASAR